MTLTRTALSFGTRSAIRDGLSQIGTVLRDTGSVAEFSELSGIGAYYAALGGLDAVVFTGGIGENDAWVRAQCCEGLTALGIELDELKNGVDDSGIFSIHDESSAVNLLFVPTNEELEIAQQTVGCVRSSLSHRP